MRDTILVVDSLDTERTEFVKILQKESKKIIEASDGEAALEIIEKNIDKLEVILLKLMIPKVDGIRLLEVMKEKDWIKMIPVLIIDRPPSVAMENKCFELGAVDFIKKPFTDSSVVHCVKNAVRSFAGSEEQKDKLEQQTKLMRQQYLLLQKQTEEFNNSKRLFIEVLGTIAEYRNMDNRAHVRNVEAITKILAGEMADTFPECGLTEEKIKLIAEASLLHDIGKITIPDSMLMKPGKLTKEEYEFMESHTAKGCEILEQLQGVLDKEYMDVCYEICRSHHERYDGNGYPDGLSGDDIPLSAQLVSVADVYDALVNDRIYKKAYSKEQAYNMIVFGGCGMFNPKIKECFIKAREKIEALYSDGQQKNDV